MPLKLKTKEEIIKLVECEADSETIEEMGSEELGCFFDGEQDDETYWIHPETKEHLTNDWFWKDDHLSYEQVKKLQSEYELVTCESDKEQDRVKFVDSGNRGDGREMWEVLHIPDYNLYIKLIGCYSSWGNSTWDSVDIVKRKKKTIYVYE